MHDEKTTEIEIPPKPRMGNILHVDFARPKAKKTQAVPTKVATYPNAREKRALSQWLFSLLALAAVVALSLFVL